eukprot:g18195.t1
MAGAKQMDCLRALAISGSLTRHKDSDKLRLRIHFDQPDGHALHFHRQKVPLRSGRPLSFDSGRAQHHTTTTTYYVGDLVWVFIGDLGRYSKEAVVQFYEGGGEIPELGPRAALCLKETLELIHRWARCIRLAEPEGEDGPALITSREPDAKPEGIRAMRARPRCQLQAQTRKLRDESRSPPATSESEESDAPSSLYSYKTRGGKAPGKAGGSARVAEPTNRDAVIGVVLVNLVGFSIEMAGETAEPADSCGAVPGVTPADGGTTRAARGPSDIMFVSTVTNALARTLGGKKDVYSIQIGAEESWSSSESLMRFCAHAYDPNCELQMLTCSTGVRVLLLVARKELTPGNAREVGDADYTSNGPAGGDVLVTLNYNSFEYTGFSTPFTCAFSGRTVNGFAACAPDEQDFLLEQNLLLPYIRDILKQERTAAPEIER